MGRMPTLLTNVLFTVHTENYLPPRPLSSETNTYYLYIKIKHSQPVLFQDSFHLRGTGLVGLLRWLGCFGLCGLNGWIYIIIDLSCVVQNNLIAFFRRQKVVRRE